MSDLPPREISESTPQPRRIWRLVYKFILISIAAHVLGLIVFGGFVIFSRMQPEQVTFEEPVKLKTVEPRKREYKLRVREQQQRSSRPKIQPRLQSLRPSPLAMPTIDTKISPVKSELDNIPGLADGIGDIGFGVGSTGQIFGVDITASRLGVVLDVSGSAHAHLDKAIAEIDKSFPDSHMVLVVGCGMSDINNIPSKINGQAVVPGRPRIVSYQDRDKEGENNAMRRSPVAQLEDFFGKIGAKKSREIRRYFDKRDNLYLLYGGDIRATHFVFDFLLDEYNTDTIYWFADFADRIDADTIKKLTRELRRNRTKVIAHNFLGNKVRTEVVEMVKATNGETIELVPGN